MDEKRRDRPGPREKKEREYEDRFACSEYPHLFRKGWPRKKAKASRRFRRRAEGLLRGLEGDAGEVLERAEDAGATEAAVRRADVRRVRKWGTVSLRDRVRLSRRERVERLGFNFFTSPYDPAEHRKPFKTFLAAQMEGRTEHTREAASFIAYLLDEPEITPFYDRHYNKRAWVAAFLRDAPGWEARLRAWIAEQEGGEE